MWKLVWKRFFEGVLLMGFPLIFEVGLFIWGNIDNSCFFDTKWTKKDTYPNIRSLKWFEFCHQMDQSRYQMGKSDYFLVF